MSPPKRRNKTEVFELKSVTHLLDLVAEHSDDWVHWFYRGHSNIQYLPIPKAGREPFAKLDDARMLASWRRHALPLLTIMPRELTSWDFLAIAQHHGLATRLLDWTSNALAAAFFATVTSDGRINADVDGAVLAHYSSERPITTEEEDRNSDPFKVTELRRVRPSSIVPRIVRQGGIFTIHYPPTRNLAETMPRDHRLKMFIIPKGLKRSFAQTLSHFGLNQLHLFPDLDGVSRHINWTFTYLPKPPGR